MIFLYNILFILPGLLLIKVLRFFMPKLKERQQHCKKSLTALDSIAGLAGRRLWVHASSMGEFEQAKPVIELLKEKHKDLIVICSFFSPSGYNNQKKYTFADAVVYLPFDSIGKVNNFIKRVKPDCALFVRYDIWFNYLNQLRRRKIPSYLICATYPKSSFMRTFPLTKWFLNNAYSMFSKIYAISDDHADYFKSIVNPADVSVTNDTRFDRIAKNVAMASQNPVLPHEIFGSDEFVLVAGSTWQPDEDIIIGAYQRIASDATRKSRLIIVPHEPTAEHISELQKKLPSNVLLSELIDKIESESKGCQLTANTIEIVKKFLVDRHIIVDSIGKLLSLYSLADAAYVGGAFGVGVHSVAEPAGYSLPLAIGAKIDGSPDAVNLYKRHALGIIENEDQFYRWMTALMNDEILRKQIGEIAGNYVFTALGSSKIIADEISHRLGFD